LKRVKGLQRLPVHQSAQPASSRPATEGSTEFRLACHRTHVRLPPALPCPGFVEARGYWACRRMNISVEGRFHTGDCGPWVVSGESSSRGSWAEKRHCCRGGPCALPCEVLLLWGPPALWTAQTYTMIRDTIHATIINTHYPSQREDARPSPTA